MSYYQLLPGQRFRFRPGDPLRTYLGDGWHFDPNYQRRFYLNCDVRVIVEGRPTHYSFSIGKELR